MVSAFSGLRRRSAKNLMSEHGDRRLERAVELHDRALLRDDDRLPVAVQSSYLPSTSRTLDHAASRRSSKASDMARYSMHGACLSVMSRTARCERDRSAFTSSFFGNSAKDFSDVQRSCRDRLAPEVVRVEDQVESVGGIGGDLDGDALLGVGRRQPLPRRVQDLVAVVRHRLAQHLLDEAAPPSSSLISGMKVTS